MGHLVIVNNSSKASGQAAPGQANALIGREKICGTVERAYGRLMFGKYEVKVAPCPLLHRKMLFLQEASQPSDASTIEPCAPCAAVCDRCRAEKKRHRTGHLQARHAIPCPMIQPGNGPFTLRHGGILVGEVHAPGFVTHSQDIFLLLYNRIKQAISRGHKVELLVMP